MALAARAGSSGDFSAVSSSRTGKRWYCRCRARASGKLLASMGKRVSNDATQELSASQLVPPARPPANPPVYGNTPKNDASAWMQAPVSADDFVSAPRRRPVAPGGGKRALVVTVMVALFVAVCGAGVWFAFLREPPKQPSPL